MAAQFDIFLSHNSADKPLLEEIGRKPKNAGFNPWLDQWELVTGNHLIRRLQKRLRVTSVVVTHDMKTAYHTADRIAYLHEGRIYFHGLPDELRTSSDPVVQDFIEGRSGDSD